MNNIHGAKSKEKNKIIRLALFNLSLTKNIKNKLRNDKARDRYELLRFLDASNNIKKKI